MFRFWRRTTEPSEKKITLENQETEIEESISVVTGKGRGEVDKAESEARQRAQDAAREELQDLRMIEDGRCPKCGRKLEMFLYTSICKNCGWNTYITPQQNGTLVRLRSGNAIRCDRVYHADHEVLCVKNKVVTHRVPHENIECVEFAWSRDELENKEAKLAAEQGGICAWCMTNLATPSPDVPAAAGETALPPAPEARPAAAPNGQTVLERLTLYVAFGAYQEKYFFCSEKCLQSFKRQNPTRVHRNCYETECADCDGCIKRHDVPRGRGNLAQLMNLLNAPR